ncbi:MAG: DUF3016 domain-containing protein [Burkholderiaceae bacterium]
MRTTSSKLLLGAALTLSATLASAAVEVHFIEPDKFTDADNSLMSGGRKRDEVLKDIQQHLRKLGDKYLPGQDLLIEVTDVDLAGVVRPVGPRMEMIRILDSIGRPAITLNYTVSRDGQELRKGVGRLSDLNYQESFNQYPGNDPLRYEKRMMDKWFEKEFGAPATRSQLKPEPDNQKAKGKDPGG